MTWLRGSRPRELGHEAYRIHRAAPSWGTTSLRALALGQGLPDAGLRVGAGEAPYQDEGGNDGSERGSGESRRTGVGFTRRSRRMNQAGKPTRGQRVALYARVSSDKQEEEGTIDCQLSLPPPACPKTPAHTTPRAGFPAWFMRRLLLVKPTPVLLDSPLPRSDPSSTPAPCSTKNPRDHVI